LDGKNPSPEDHILLNSPVGAEGKDDGVGAEGFERGWEQEGSV